MGLILAGCKTKWVGNIMVGYEDHISDILYFQVNRIYCSRALGLDDYH